MIESLIATFYERLRCRKCHQNPLFEPETLLVNENHHLPRHALQLWRALRKEIETQDVMLLRQQHFDDYLKRLDEIERLYLEGGEAAVGCGVESWNGWRASPGVG